MNSFDLPIYIYIHILCKYSLVQNKHFCYAYTQLENLIYHKEVNILTKHSVENRFCKYFL